MVRYSEFEVGGYTGSIKVGVDLVVGKPRQINVLVIVGTHMRREVPVDCVYEIKIAKGHFGCMYEAPGCCMK